MKKIILVLLITAVFGCDNKFQKTGLNQELYNAILDYQKKYPIPKKSIKIGSKPIYVYNAYFWKENQDTILVMQRSSAGISKLTKGFGIYEDEKLNPTFIIDDKHLGSRFLIKRIVSNSNHKFYWDDNRSFPENFPPVHKYSIKNKEIKLIMIDTIWKHWD